VTVSLPEDCRLAGNIVVGGQDAGATLNADPQKPRAEQRARLQRAPQAWSAQLVGRHPQDLTHSTYDQDPELSAQGVPGNVALVDGKGPADIAGLALRLAVRPRPRGQVHHPASRHRRDRRAVTS